MLAAAPVPVEALPAHRVALRAGLWGVAGSVAAVAVALPLIVVASRTNDEAMFLGFLAVASGLTMGALFAVAVELARRLPAAGRLASLIAMGALAPAFVMAALIWLVFLIRGDGPEVAWLRVVEFTGKVLTSWLDDTLPTAAAVLIPFSLVGAAHAGGVPGVLRRVPPLRARVAIAAVTGAVSLMIAWAAYLPRGPQRALFFGFLLSPPALEVAVTLALRVEARLLTWWAKRREAA